MSSQKLGSIVWRDLTVPDAGKVSEFYSQVAGWRTFPHDMGEYHDYDVKLAEDGDSIAGICYARGGNANVPPQWLIYILVEDAAAGAEKAVALGGAIIDGPRQLGSGQFCVIRDPAGAMFALISEA